MNQSKLNLIKNQACNENSYISFLNRVREILRRLSKSKRFLLNNLAYFDQKYRIASPSQTTLGYYSGIGREHTNRSLQELQDLDLIEITTRYKTTCIYKLNPLFYYPEIAHALKHLLPNLALGLLLTLAFSPAAAIQKNVTLIKVNPSPSVINSYLAKRKEQLNVSSQVTKRIVRPLSCQLQNGWSDFFKKIINGERMDIQFLPALENFKSLGLTQKGKSALMAYCNEVIAWSDEVLMRRGTKDDSYNYLVKLCEVKSQLLGVKPDYSLSRKLLAHFDFPDSEPFVSSNKVNQPMVNKAANLPKKSFNSQKQEGKNYRRQEYQPADRKFMPGCTRTNHNSSIRKMKEVLEQLPFNLDYQSRAALVGGEDYIKAVIFRNEECLELHHKHEKNEGE